MTQTSIARIAFGAAALLLAGTAQSQDDGRIAAEIVPGLDLRGGGERRFAANDLREGDQFPAIEIFDEIGNPFNTATLRGKYTVLVNGCLT